jgi:hypothetical protein
MKVIRLMIAAFAACGTAAFAQSPTLVVEEMMVPAQDPGIQVFVRNKRPADMTAFRPERTLVFVHGATYPAHTAFDLKLGGFSWMDYIASRGRWCKPARARSRLTERSPRTRRKRAGSPASPTTRKPT